MELRKCFELSTFSNFFALNLGFDGSTRCVAYSIYNFKRIIKQGVEEGDRLIYSIDTMLSYEYSIKSNFKYQSGLSSLLKASESAESFSD